MSETSSDVPEQHKVNAKLFADSFLTYASGQEFDKVAEYISKAIGIEKTYVEDGLIGKLNPNVSLLSKEDLIKLSKSLELLYVADAGISNFVLQQEARLERYKKDNDANSKLPEGHVTRVEKKNRMEAQQALVNALKELVKTLITTQMLALLNEVIAPDKDCATPIRELVVLINDKLKSVNAINLTKLSNPPPAKVPPSAAKSPSGAGSPSGAVSPPSGAVSTKVPDEPPTTGLKPFGATPAVGSPKIVKISLGEKPTDIATEVLDKVSAAAPKPTDESTDESTPFVSANPTPESSASTAFVSPEESTTQNKYFKMFNKKSTPPSFFNKYFGMFGGSSSYEQKYMKYKAKYLELKQSLRRF